MRSITESIKNLLSHPVLWVLMVLPALWPAPTVKAEEQIFHPIALKAATIELVSPTAWSQPAKIKPDFQDSSFPLRDAANLEAILEIIGPLSLAEEVYLEKNRFLVKPKPRQLTFRPVTNQPIYDEMLANFDGIGGSIREDLRVPHNARFIGPDIFLHAFNKYVSRRLVTLEIGPMSRHVEFMLTGLYHNAQTLKSASTGPAKEAWERLMAQLVVPLVLIKNGGTDLPDLSSPPPDNLKAALYLFQAYQSHFSPKWVSRISDELTLIYQAEALAAGGLGLVPASETNLISYSRFQPPGHYLSRSRARAYFRAMTWLGYLGWDPNTSEGLTDALNFALAMSYEAPPVPVAASESEAPPSRIYAIRASAPPEEARPTPTEPTNIRQAWARVMELNTFFLGFSETLSYFQWIPFLMKEANVSEFRADTAVDPVVLERLAAAADSLDSFKPFSQSTTPGQDRTIITVFPQRFTIPKLITDQLTYRLEVNERAPAMFSGLWIPALLGQEYARDLVPRQLALTFGGDPVVLKSVTLRDLVKLTTADLLNLMDSLTAKLSGSWGQPAPPWDSSLSYARVRLLASLASKFKSGYPLYMRSPAYQARRLESILATYAEILYDPPLMEKSLPRRPQKNDDAEKGVEAALVKGFIEPDPAFWQEMMRTTQFLADGFRKYGLFPEDLEEMGSLSRFKKRLERCAALGGKELQGLELTSDDYEFIRLFTLNWMAAPPGQENLAPPLDEIRAAVLAPIQSFGLEGEPDSTVYEANGEPNLILVLVGNEQSPRLTLGLTYNHFEFITPKDKPLKVKDWDDMVYNRYLSDPDPTVPELPIKNFWYDPLKP